jgi:hypothetical protein
MRTTTLLLTTVLALFPAAPVPAQEADLAHLREVAKVLEKGAADFSDRFDKELDKSILDDTAMKGRLDQRAEKFRRAVDDMRDKLKAGKIDKARPKLDRALQLANDLNLVMMERRFSEKLENQWADIVFNINELAAYYDLRPLT